MNGRVSITLPTGEAATVPEVDLKQALAAGAHMQTEHEATQGQLGGLGGQATSALTGMARGGTFGLYDAALVEGARAFGGESDARAMSRGLQTIKEANPYSSMGGEAAGLLLGAEATGLGAVGGGIEAGVGELAGTGMGARALGLGARGAFEGSAIGAGRHLSETELGDPNANAEKLWMAMGKDALIGGIGGAALGGLGHGISSVLSKGKGPLSGSLLDEVVGVEGAGKGVHAEARSQQQLISDLQKTGATSEQAARMVDDLGNVAKARSAAGPLESLVDEGANAYIAKRAAGNGEMGDVLGRGYADRATRLAKQDEIVADQALKMKKATDEVFRNVRDVLDDAQFTQKSEQMAKLVDASKFGVQRDTMLSLMQDVDGVLGFWESTATKGGAEGAIKGLRKQLTDFMSANARIEAEGGPMASRDFFMRANGMKQGIDRVSRFGSSKFGLPEAVDHPDFGLRALGNKFRSTLEDESVWGDGALAQKEWNGTFSGAQARVSEFDKRFTNTIDSSAGNPVRSGDAGKFFESLGRLDNPAKSLEDIKTVDATMAGLKDRIAALRKYGDISPAQAAKLAAGEKAIASFEDTYLGAQKEAAMVQRLKQQQLEEQGRSLGGIMGLASDIITKPLTTLERLAAVKRAAARADKLIADGIEGVFQAKRPPVNDAVPRSSKDVVKEIGQIRQLAANPGALQARVATVLDDMGKHAPKTAQALALQMTRAITYLASEAPTPRSTSGPFVAQPELRLSDQQITEWERKRDAAFDPSSVLVEMKAGKLNRDGIKAAEMVSPVLFGQMQQLAQEQIQRLAAEGKLDKMPIQQQAAIATLLKVPPNGKWEPDFIMMMQAAKAMPPQPQPMPGAPPPQRPKTSPVKLDGTAFETTSQQIEGRSKNHG